MWCWNCILALTRRTVVAGRVLSAPARRFFPTFDPTCSADDRKVEMTPEMGKLTQVLNWIKLAKRKYL
jgi:hypothetical protein